MHVEVPVGPPQAGWAFGVTNAMFLNVQALGSRFMSSGALNKQTDSVREAIMYFDSIANTVRLFVQAPEDLNNQSFPKRTL